MGLAARLRFVFRFSRVLDGRIRAAFRDLLSLRYCFATFGPISRAGRNACGKIVKSRALALFLPISGIAARSPHFIWIVAMYQSDITQFLQQLKAQKPTLEAEQRQGRSLLWDKRPVDLDEAERAKQSRVNQSAYVYYQKF